MSAYLVVEAILTDPVKFKAYAELVPKLVSDFGGEYLSLGGLNESLEGEWGKTRIVLHRWPDLDAARHFWHSPEYQNAKKLRQNTGTFRIMLVDGLNTETLEQE